MHNIILFRPYKSIKKSLESLPDDLVVLSKINSFLAIEAIISNNKKQIMNNHDVYYYYNHGEPYWKDLLKYYNIAHSEWNKRGGNDYNLLISKNLLGTLGGLSKKSTMCKWDNIQQKRHKNIIKNYIDNK